MPSRPSATQTLQYRIADIRELELVVPYLPEDLIKDFDERRLDYQFNFDHQWNLEKNRFSILVGVTYAYLSDGDAPEELLNFLGEVEFLIDGLARFIDLKNKEIHFPEEFLAILTGISISTVRGMIAIRTIGKFQGRFFIPILDPKAIVRDHLRMKA